MTEGTGARAGRYRFANVEFDEATMTLVVDGVCVSLERRPLQVLTELLHHPNEVVTREELFESVWNGRPTVDNVLANAITKLRKALGADAGSRIINIPRVGYRLTGDVHFLPALPALDSIRWSGVMEPGGRIPGREHFKIIRPLDRDSRAHVWLALHEKTGRERVFKFAHDAEAIRRLRREYSLSRLLRSELGPRPDIVSVLHARLTEPPYYIETEYGGVNLLDWAEDPDGLASTDLPERLRLFIDVATAVAAAHQVGVLHRDIKPANILLYRQDGCWKPRLTDFGIGQAQHIERLVASGVTLGGLTGGGPADRSPIASGTEMYLAPEVLAGDASTQQSDVYALGVVLFQMVAGDLERPLATGWERAVADPLLCDDIRDATEGQPDNRLHTVQQLLERVRTLESRREALERQTREHALAEQALARRALDRAQRPWKIMAAVIATVGVATGVWLWSQTSDALEQTRDLARRSASLVDFLTIDVLQAADISRVAGSRLPSMEEVVRKATEAASGRFEGQPLAEALIRRHLADILLRSMSVFAAVAEYERALQLLDESRGGSADELARVLAGLARARVQASRIPEAEVAIDRAAKLSGQRYGDLDEESRLLLDLAHVEVRAARRDAASGIPLARALVGRAQASRDVTPGFRLEARQLLADLLMSTDETRAEGEALLESLSAEPFDEQSVGIAAHVRAELALNRLRIARGQTEPAEQSLVKLRQKLATLLGPEAYHLGLVTFELADLYSASKRSELALEQLEAAERAFVATLGPDHGYAISVRTNKALSMLQLDRPREAIEILDAVLPWYRKRNLSDAIQYYRATALNDLQRPDEALAALTAIDAANAGWWHTVNDANMPWKVEFERGRALLWAGNRAEARRILQGTLQKARVSGQVEWERRIARYVERAGQDRTPTSASRP